MRPLITVILPLFSYDHEASCHIHSAVPVRQGIRHRDEKEVWCAPAVQLTIGTWQCRTACCDGLKSLICFGEISCPRAKLMSNVICGGLLCYFLCWIVPFWGRWGGAASFHSLYGHPGRSLHHLDSSSQIAARFFVITFFHGN